MERAPPKFEFENFEFMIFRKILENWKFFAKYYLTSTKLTYIRAHQGVLVGDEDHLASILNDLLEG